MRTKNILIIVVLCYVTAATVVIGAEYVHSLLTSLTRSLYGV